MITGKVAVAAAISGVESSQRHNVVLTIPRPGTAELAETPFPIITPGYVLLEVAIAPICVESRIWTEHTFEHHDGPDHLGHEGVGTVVETAAGSRFSVGDRVVVFQGDHCGKCYACRNGLSPTYCAWNVPPARALLGIEDHTGSVSGGMAMVRYRIAHEQNVVEIPDDLDFRYAAAANCSLGCTYTGQQVIGVKPGEWVLVAGVGFLGLGHIINAHYRGAKVIALVRNRYRADLCRQLGVAHIVDPDAPDWMDQIREITDGELADVAVECSGAAYYQRKCMEAMHDYGRLHTTGWLPGERLVLDVEKDIVDRHLMITGGHDVRMTDRPGLLRMLADPEVQRGIDVMVTHEFPMSRAAEALDISASKQCGKIYLYPQS